MTQPERLPSPPTAPTLVAGDVSPGRPPEWLPLLELVGELTRDFMWMSTIVLDTGADLYAYRHRLTRRYIHLTPAGEAYAEVPAARDSDWRYRPISRREALDYAFAHWDEVSFGDDDYAELRRELSTALGRAERGESPCHSIRNGSRVSAGSRPPC